MNEGALILPRRDFRGAEWACAPRADYVFLLKFPLDVAKAISSERLDVDTREVTFSCRQRPGPSGRTPMVACFFPLTTFSCGASHFFPPPGNKMLRLEGT